jgi:hypothetical protein
MELLKPQYHKKGRSLYRQEGLSGIIKNGFIETQRFCYTYSCIRSGTSQLLF